MAFSRLHIPPRRLNDAARVCARAYTCMLCILARARGDARCVCQVSMLRFYRRIFIYTSGFNELGVSRGRVRVFRIRTSIPCARRVSQKYIARRRDVCFKRDARRKRSSACGAIYAHALMPSTCVSLTHTSRGVWTGPKYSTAVASSNPRRLV